MCYLQERDSLRAALTTPIPGGDGSGGSSSSDTIAAKLAFAQAASRAAQAETRVLDLTHQLETLQVCVLTCMLRMLPSVH